MPTNLPPSTDPVNLIKPSHYTSLFLRQTPVFYPTHFLKSGFRLPLQWKLSFPMLLILLDFSEAFDSGDHLLFPRFSWLCSLLVLFLPSPFSGSFAASLSKLHPLSRAHSLLSHILFWWYQLPCVQLDLHMWSLNLHIYSLHLSPNLLSPITTGVNLYLKCPTGIWKSMSKMKVIFSQKLTQLS